MTDTIDAVVDSIASVAPDVRAGLTGRRTYDAGANPSGDRQLEADIYADELLKERLLALESVVGYASEERGSAVGPESDGPVPEDDRRYVAVDPLDGSSNLKSNNTMGTLFAVYDEPLPTDGSALLASGFVLYGPITTMVVAREGTVTESVIEEGTRRTVDADLTLPEEPTVYGFGGRVPQWREDFSEYVSEVESELKLRYGGAMIGDVNHVLTYGGIFGYPGLRDRPEGKLRLCFEGHPIAHIVETAGGASSNGEQSLLSLTPDRLHERTPLFVGNEAYIDRLEATLE